MMAQPRSCWAHLQSDGPPQSHGISQNRLALAFLHCNCTVAATPRQAHAITFPRGPARYTAAHAPTLLRSDCTTPGRCLASTRPKLGAAWAIIQATAEKGGAGLVPSSWPITPVRHAELESIPLNKK